MRVRFSSIIFGFIWKKPLITCTVDLVLGFRNSLLDACEINTDHADAGFQPAAPSRFRSLTLTNCCRSRFVVANYVSESPSNAQSRLREQLAVRRERRVAAPKGERRVCVVCVHLQMRPKHLLKPTNHQNITAQSSPRRPSSNYLRLQPGIRKQGIS